MKFPYGGFWAEDPFKGKTPWEKLEAISEHLRRGDPLPPPLAEWLGKAIDGCARDDGKLLLLLGLKRPRGNQRISLEEQIRWGARVCDLEDEGMRPEHALTQALRESNDLMTRSTLQRWAKTYREARSAHE